MSHKVLEPGRFCYLPYRSLGSSPLWLLITCMRVKERRSCPKTGVSLRRWGGGTVRNARCDNGQRTFKARWAGVFAVSGRNVASWQWPRKLQQRFPSTAQASLPGYPGGGSEEIKDWPPGMSWAENSGLAAAGSERELSRGGKRDPGLPSSFYLLEDSALTAGCETGFGHCNWHHKVAPGLATVKIIASFGSLSW